MDHERRSHEALHDTESGAVVAATIAHLGALGLCVTSSRRALIEVLATRPGHLTVEAIAGEVGETHRATVYRTVELLEAAGVLSVWRDTRSPTRVHLVSMGTPSQHLHAGCRTCDVVEALPVEVLDGVAGRASAASGFAIDVHNSFLVGTCGACRRTSVPLPSVRG